MANLRRHGDFFLHGHRQIGLMPPAPRIGRPLPALHRNGLDVASLLGVEQVHEGGAIATSHLRRGTMEVDQRLGPIVEDCDGAPALGFRFGLVRHGDDPPWSNRNWTAGAREPIFAKWVKIKPRKNAALTSRLAKDKEEEVRPPSSSGPGHSPLTAKTGVQIPLGVVDWFSLMNPGAAGFRILPSCRG